MPGGLLSITACGTQNVILTGNPSKTFFKCAYCKYTNFGLQKFRLDFDGQRVLRENSPSTFTFPVPRHADLLMDTYLVVRLPEIWSPILPPAPPHGDTGWRPYEFKWIKDLGSQMVEEITFTVGGQIVQKFSGQYMRNLVERDFTAAKSDLYYKMSGNVAELNDPANALGRDGHYPSAYHNGPGSAAVPEPSIRSRRLYIPLNIWFTMASSMAFPLVSLQYSELEINVRLRPIRELFVIRDPTASAWPTLGVIPGPTVPNGNTTTPYEATVAPVPAPYIQPNFNLPDQQLFLFLEPPPDVALSPDKYKHKGGTWGADVHLLCTYAFLDKEEVAVFAKKEQSYLVKEVYEHEFTNLFGSTRSELETAGLVANWMWFYQRTDAHKRNEWSNYTNWPFSSPPVSLQLIEEVGAAQGLAAIADGSGNLNWTASGKIFFTSPAGGSAVTLLTPTRPPYAIGVTDLKLSDSLYVTPPYSVENQRLIMLNWGLLVDGKYRENPQPAGVLEFAEPYAHALGSSTEGLYFYSFGLDTNPYDCQPSGAMNLSRFSRIEFENETIPPPLDSEARVMTVCDPSGNTIGINKPVWNIYKYTYNLHVFEERYNVVTFTSGMAGLMFAR